MPVQRRAWSTQSYGCRLAVLFTSGFIHYKSLKAVTTKRVGVSVAMGRVRTMANRRGHTTGSTRPDTTGGELVLIALTASEEVVHATDASRSKCNATQA